MCEGRRWGRGVGVILGARGVVVRLMGVQTGNWRCRLWELEPGDWELGIGEVMGGDGRC